MGRGRFDIGERGGVRGWGLAVLLLVGSPPARADTLTPLLAECERGPVKVRVQTCTMLGLIGHARATDTLARALRDDEIAVRAAAAAALGRLRDAPEATAPLVKALGDTAAWVRREAAEALGARGDPSALTALDSAAKDADPAVRLAARVSQNVLAARASRLATAARLAQPATTPPNAAPPNTAPPSAAPTPSAIASATVPASAVSAAGASATAAGAPPAPKTVLDADSAYGEDLGPAPADPRAHCEDALRLYARNPNHGNRRLYELVWRVDNESAKEDAADIVRTLGAPSGDVLSRAHRCCRMAKAKTAALRRAFECLGRTFPRKAAAQDPGAGD